MGRRSTAAGLCALVAVAGTATALAGPRDAEQAGGSRCAPRGSDKLWGSPRARVYRSASERTTVGCWLPTGRRTGLDAPPYVIAFPPPAIALAGPLVATAIEGTGDQFEESDTLIRVHDLRTGEPSPSFAPRRTPYATSRPNSFDAKVGSMKVKANGAVAWIACRAQYTVPEEWGDPRPNCVRRGAFNEVRKYDARSPDPVTLDRGRGIDPRSLRRKGSRIYWRHGKRRRSAPLR